MHIEMQDNIQYFDTLHLDFHTWRWLVRYLYHILKGRQPASLHTCVLVRKTRQNLDIPLDYLGFEIPDVWVVGYGLDYADRYRTLPYVAELKKEIYSQE